LPSAASVVGALLVSVEAGAVEVCAVDGFELFWHPVANKAMTPITQHASTLVCLITVFFL
jgi:hypothetical protein